MHLYIALVHTYGLRLQIAYFPSVNLFLASAFLKTALSLGRCFTAGFTGVAGSSNSGESSPPPKITIKINGFARNKW